MAKLVVDNAVQNQADGAPRLLQDLERLSSADSSPTATPSISLHDPSPVLRLRCTAYLRERLEVLWTQELSPQARAIGLDFHDDLHPDPTTKSFPCDFTISFPSAQLRVHAWVLYNRWKWFASMIDSGLTESTDKVLALSSDSIGYRDMIRFLRFIYTNRLDHIPDAKSISSLLPHLEFFGIVDSSGESLPPFEPLVYRINITQ
jgi:hypothetical protein